MGPRHLITIVAAGAALASCQPAHGPMNVDGLAPGSRPNILMIVADDLGYLDLGLYGSEIRTPNIDALAAGGLVLTNYYTAAMCAPTRSMLLSGTDNHIAGLGAQGAPERVRGAPGYEGYLNHRIVSIATRMANAGYHTSMSGKWHLGYADDQRPAARGFERSFSLLDPGAGHFGDMMSAFSLDAKAQYRDDDIPVEELPEDFYSTIAYTDHMIDYVDEAHEQDRPFFGYLAYTAPHWPTHALPEDMAKTRGRYDEGYDVIRERRFEAWKAAGFGDADDELPNTPVEYVPWDDLSAEEQALQARVMEAYAAMVERLDAEIGRLLAHLEAIGERDNTLIVFVSDNGAEGFGDNFLGELRSNFDNSLENIGHPGSYELIGPGWAEAGSAPFWLRKTFTSEGGIHVPGIVNGAGLGVPVGRSDAQIAVQDMAPTFLELAGAPITWVADGREAPAPITGRSFAGVLRGDPGAARTDEDIVAWELHGHRAIRRGDWKATWIQPPQGPGAWELFNIAEDPAERHDRSADEPELFAELTAAWDDYAEEYGVVVIE